MQLSTHQPIDFSRVIILYGALRSGTTLFRLLLDSHPKMLCPGERDFMLDYIRGADFNKEGLLSDRIFNASGLTAPKASSGHAVFRELLTEQVEQAARSESTLVLVFHRHLDLLLDLLPECRIIHLVRDPRDVARSSIGMGWAGSTLYGINHWLKTEKSWAREAARIEKSKRHTIRFEDLVIDPEAQLALVCSFVGQSYSPAMMEYTKVSSYQDLDRALAFQWKRTQTAEEIAHVEYKVGGLLEELGYEPSGHTPVAPSGSRALRLWLENKITIWRFRRMRYGLRDSLIVALARKLRMPSLSRSAQKRIDDALTANLK